MLVPVGVVCQGTHVVAMAPRLLIDTPNTQTALRIVAFLVACSIGANWLVVPPLIWLARQQDHVIHVDANAEWVAALGATATMLR